jgi:hypothetical protein
MATTKKVSPPRPQKGMFHSVEIRCTSQSCAPALKMEGKRFLSSQAPPQLPLRDCDRADCTCRYIHHRDRRSEDDRRSVKTVNSEAEQLRGSKRSGRGRRNAE